MTQYEEHLRDEQASTPRELELDYADRAGALRPDVAWIVTPFDTVVANPHYAGPPVPHPDDDEYQHATREQLQRRVARAREHKANRSRRVADQRTEMKIRAAERAAERAADELPERDYYEGDSPDF